MRSSSPPKLSSYNSLQSPSHSPVFNFSRRKTKIINEGNKYSSGSPSLNLLSPVTKRPSTSNQMFPILKPKSPSPISFLRKNLQEKDKQLIRQSPDPRLPQYMMSPFPLNRIATEQSPRNKNIILSPAVQNKPTHMCITNPNPVSGSVYDFKPPKLSREDLEVLLLSMKDLASLAKPSSKANPNILNKSLEVHKHTLAEALEISEETPNIEKPTRNISQPSEDSFDSFLGTKSPLRHVYRRKSCCCNWCGGVSRLQSETENNPWVPPIIKRQFFQNGPNLINQIALGTLIRGNKRLQTSLLNQNSNRKGRGSKARLSVATQGGPARSSGVINTEDSERPRDVEDNKLSQLGESYRGGAVDMGIKVLDLLGMMSGLGDLNEKKKKGKKNNKRSVEKQKSMKFVRKESKVVEGRKKTHKIVAPPSGKKPSETQEKNHTMGSYRSTSPPNTNHATEPAERMTTMGEKSEFGKASGVISSFRIHKGMVGSPKAGANIGGVVVETPNTKGRKVVNQSKVVEISKDNLGKSSMSMAMSRDQETLHFATQGSNDEGKIENKGQRKLKEFMSSTFMSKNESVKKIYLSKNSLKIRSFDVTRDMSPSTMQRETPGLGNTTVEDTKVTEVVEIKEDNKMKDPYERFKMFQNQKQRKRYIV